MLVFILSFIFHADPDFWLPDAEIDTQFTAFHAQLIEGKRNSLALTYAEIAKNPKDRIAPGMIASAQQMVRSIENLEKELLQMRFKRRVELLFNLKPMKKR
jgi:hypothetical protein